MKLDWVLFYRVNCPNSMVPISRRVFYRRLMTNESEIPLRYTPQFAPLRTRDMGFEPVEFEELMRWTSLGSPRLENYMLLY